MNFTGKKIGQYEKPHGKILSVLFGLIVLTTTPGLLAQETATNIPTLSRENKIVFDRDIRPILETSCLRCHGPEKPKSHFRLDNRLDAIKGGDGNTNDLVPGDSVHSLLIKYVAREVPDMEMPPIGKGDPLTSAQIKLLRDWIDEGMEWSTTNHPPSLSFAFAPEFRWIGVSGNQAKFRELEGVKQGVGGGVENFSATQQVSPDTKVSISGHALVPGPDISVLYAADKQDFGFVHAGFTQWRKYYSDDGGYDPAVVPPGYNPNRNLYIDNGDAWIDFGLALPNRPQIVLGYEYQYRNGTQSTPDWGLANTKNIYPATEGVDEKTHIIKLTVTHDIDDWHLEDHARVEFYRLNDNGNEPEIILGGPTTDTTINTRDTFHSIQGMNTFTAEKQIEDWWFASGGLYYSKLVGSDFFNQTTAIPSIGFNNTLSSQQITLRRESEIFSLASLFTPLEYLSLSVGTQNEWTSEEGFGSTVPDIDLAINAPAGATCDTFKSSQNANVRFTKIPFSVLFADVQLEQESIDEFEDQDPTETIRRTAVVDSRYDVKGGFNVSPWRWFAWNAQYERKSSNTSYNTPVDSFNGVPGPTNGYPGFILNRKIQGNEFDTKIDLRPVRWLKTTLTYQASDTEYSSRTDPAIDPVAADLVSPGGYILDGHYRMQTYGFNATLTPVQQLYLNGNFTYSHSRAVTADNGDPSIVPYSGNIFTVSGTATYAISVKTALSASYIFTTSDYGENNGAAGVPMGLDFTRHELLAGVTRQLTKHLTGALHYEFSQYTEGGGNSANNFTANGIFASLAYR